MIPSSRSIASAKACAIKTDEETMSSVEPLATSHRLAGSFRRLGWIGFWLQFAIGAISVLLLFYAFAFAGGGGISTRGRFALIDYLAIGSLLVLTFTTAWFYRYTRLARELAKPDHLWTPSRLHRMAWIGVAASTLGIVFSVLVMMFEVAQLFFYFLHAPQGGVPVVQTTSGGAASWVSAGDMLSIIGLIITTLVEIVALSLGLWLMFLTAGYSTKVDTVHEDLTNRTLVEHPFSSTGSP
jgi:hypothetical protein